MQNSSINDAVKRTERLENSINHRKSIRLSDFDRSRINLGQCESPVRLPMMTREQLKRQQLEMWKANKEKQKKEAYKKKPFLVGAPRVPLKYVPPPPLPRQKLLQNLPSTSGVVTRSQAARNLRQTQTKEKEAKLYTLAPKEASFQPPVIKNLTKPPAFGDPKAKNDKRSIQLLRFEPVVAVKKAEQTRSTAKQNGMETRTFKKVNQFKPVNSIQSSSSSISTISTPNRKFLKIPKVSITKCESSALQERLQSPKPSKDFLMIPEHMEKDTLNVIVSRGKDKARTETIMKLKEGLLDKEASDMRRRSLKLASETKSLTEMCEECDTSMSKIQNTQETENVDVRFKKIEDAIPEEGLEGGA